MDRVVKYLKCAVYDFDKILHFGIVTERMKRKEASVTFTVHIKELQDSKMKVRQSKVLLTCTPREGMAPQEN